MQLDAFRGTHTFFTAAKTLNRLAAKIDTAKMRPPAFKMVLTALGSFAYTREDGVFVCPIACLKP